MKSVKNLIITVITLLTLMIIPTTLNTNASHIHAIHHAKYNLVLSGTNYVTRTPRGKRVFGNNVFRNITPFNVANNKPVLWKAYRKTTLHHVTYYKVMNRKLHRYDKRYYGWIPAKGLAQNNNKINKLTGKLLNKIDKFTMADTKKSRKYYVKQSYKVANQFKDKNLRKAARSFIRDNL